MDEWIDAGTAAERLGVKPATLYAYVSRGVLRRRRAEDGRRSLFSLAEVEQLARRGRPRNQPPELVIESRVTTLGVDRPYYRGIDALELARTATFESVAEWLWTGEPARAAPLEWTGDPEGVRAAVAAQLALPDGLLPIDRLQVSTTVLGATDSLRYQLDPASVAATGRRLIAGLIDSLPIAGQSSASQSSAGQAFAQQSSVGQASGQQSSVQQSSGGQSSVGQASAQQSSAQQSSAGESSAQQSSAGQAFAQQSSVGQASGQQSSVQQSSGGQSSVGQASAQQSSAQQSSAGESSAQQSSAGQSFAGRSPADQPSTGLPSAGLVPTDLPSAGRAQTDLPSAGVSPTGLPSASQATSAGSRPTGQPAAGLSSTGLPATGGPLAREGMSSTGGVSAAGGPLAREGVSSTGGVSAREGMSVTGGVSATGGPLATGLGQAGQPPSGSQRTARPSGRLPSVDAPAAGPATPDQRLRVAEDLADLPIAEATGHGGVADRLWARLCPTPPTPALLAALQAALVLLADHELAASTLAARVAASAKADPYAVVLTGLGVLGGPLHGGASYEAERLLAEVTEPGRAARVIADRIRRGERIPGYGHSVYKNGDARGAFLMELVEAAASGHDRLDAARALRVEVRRRRLPEPNIDFALAGLVAVSGMIPGAGEAIFAVARIAGWLAHAMEEYAKGTLLRLRATPR